MKAKVLIERLELHAYHGWHPHEGEFGQPYTIDVELLTDVDRAAGTDHLSDTMDYGVIVETITRIFTERRHKLVESAVVELNAQMAKTGRSLGFSYDEAAGQSVIRVINKDTGAVLRQMPGEAVLSVAHSIESLKGILYSNLA